MRFLLDSSIYISLLNTQDKGHQPTKDFLKDLDSVATSFIIPTLVVLEVTNVLQKQKDRTATKKVLSLFDDCTIVPLDKPFVYRAIKILPKINLKTSDAIIAATAHLNKATLISWDKQLIKEANRIIPARTPTSYN